MFDKEEYKKEVFRKYQKKLNSKITFRNRIKKALLATTCCASILLVTILVMYEKDKFYEKSGSNSKNYYYDETVNVVENKEINNNNNNSLISENNEVEDSSINYHEENNIVEPPNEQINYEPSSDFFKLLKIVELEPTYYGVNEENTEVIEATVEGKKYNYSVINWWDYQAQITKDYYIVEKQDGKLVITIKDTEIMRGILSNLESLGIEYGKSYIIDSDIDVGNINVIFYAVHGQDVSDPLIVYLIQKDGTVKGIDVGNGCKTGKFVVDDIGLNNIERLENANCVEDGYGGAVTTVAFSKDNKIYELNDYDYKEL